MWSSLDVNTNSKSTSELQPQTFCYDLLHSEESVGMQKTWLTIIQS